MKSILTKLTMGLLCVSLASAPAGAAIERVKAKTEATTSTQSAAEAIATASKSNAATKLTRAEKRDARKALMSALRVDSTMKLLAALIAIFVIGIGPAIAMFIIDGDLTKRVLIALILGLLFHIPGMIYALIQIFGKGSKG